LLVGDHADCPSGLSPNAFPLRGQLNPEETGHFLEDIPGVILAFVHDLAGRGFHHLALAPPLVFLAGPLPLVLQVIQVLLLLARVLLGEAENEAAGQVEFAGQNDRPVFVPAVARNDINRSRELGVAGMVFSPTPYSAPSSSAVVFFWSF